MRLILEGDARPRGLRTKLCGGVVKWVALVGFVKEGELVILVSYYTLKEERGDYYRRVKGSSGSGFVWVDCLGLDLDLGLGFAIV